MRKQFLAFLLFGVIGFVIFNNVNVYWGFSLFFPFLFYLFKYRVNHFYYIAASTVLLFFFNPIIPAFIILYCLLLLLGRQVFKSEYYFLSMSFLITALSGIVYINIETPELMHFYFYSLLLSGLFHALLGIYQFWSKESDYPILLLSSCGGIMVIGMNIDISLMLVLSLAILILASIKTNNSLCLMISIVIMSYQFYQTENYYLLSYPIVTYLTLYFHYEIFGAGLIGLILLDSYRGEIHTESIIIGLSMIAAMLPKISTKKDKPHVYEMVFADINNEILNFCSFLDLFEKIKPDEALNQRINYCYNSLIEANCSICKFVNSCFPDRRVKVYLFLKDLLRHGEFALSQNKNTHGLYDICPYKYKMAKEATALKNKYSLDLSARNHYDLNGLSKTIREYFIDMNSPKEHNLEHLISFQRILTENGISLRVYEPKVFSNNKFFVRFGVEKKKNKLSLYRQIENLSSKYFGSVDILAEKQGDHYDYFTISPKSRYSIQYEQASIAKNNFAVCGDNYFANAYPDGRFVCCLSDGMGAGYEAFAQSKEALEMVERIGKCNLHSATAINILNTFYSYKTPGESFPTMDYLSIDLQSGQALIYKMGASTTFFISGESITPIYNQNLPFGITEHIETEEMNLCENDLIIMVSDGITEHINEQKLLSFIDNLKTAPLHKLVYDLLQTVYHEQQNKALDDMTVIAMKVNGK